MIALLSKTILILLAAVAALENPPSEGKPKHANSKAAPKKRSEREIQVLVDRLSHPEFLEREEAARELLEIGHPALKLLDRISSVESIAGWRARNIALSIRGYSPEAERRIAELVDLVSTGPVRNPQALAEEIIRYGPAAVDHAEKVLASRGDEARSFRARLLAQAAEAAVQGVSIGISPDEKRVRELLRSAGVQGIAALQETAIDKGQPVGMRLFALNGIARASRERAADVSCQLIADPQPVIGRSAMRILEEMAEGRHWPAIARGVLALGPKSRNAGARSLILTASSRLGREELEKHLKGRDPAVRRMSVWALGLRKEEKSIPALRNVLSDRDPGVRAEAAEALASFAREEDLPPLVDLLAKEKDAEVRRRIAEALSRWEGEAARRWLAVLLRDPSPWVRRRAASLLARNPDKTLVPVLAATVRDPDASVAREALAAVRAIAGRDVPNLPDPPDADERRKELSKFEAWWRQQEEALLEKEKIPAAQASESGRILEELGKLITKKFYGVGRSEKFEVSTLLQPTRIAMAQAQCGNEAARPFLQHLLQRGTFYDLHDLGRFPAALPLPWKPEDWIGVLNTGARALVAGVQDPFTRLLISHDPQGKFSKEIIPILFGGSKTNGLLVHRSGDFIEVEFVLYDSPAYWAGIVFGDRIILVNGKPAAKMDEDLLNQRLSEKVDVTIFREGWLRPENITLEPSPVFEGEIARGEVLPGGIGYLRLQYFGIDGATRFEWVLRRLESQKIKCLIVDLRNNPGGLVATAVELADKFLPAGKKITALQERESKEQEFKASDSETDRTYPLVVLINRSSASASEMVSGAWKDLERGFLVGTRTYGKGVGQQSFAVMGLPGKSILGTTAPLYLLILTTARYTLPSGKNPHTVGVSPHVEVRPPAESGERRIRLGSIARSKRFQPYVEKLLKEHRTEAARLARFDGRDPSRWPGLQEFAASLKKPFPLEDIRSSLRREIRARLAKEDPKSVLVDLDDDPVLRTAVREAARQAGLEIGEIPEYGGTPKPGSEEPAKPDDGKETAPESSRKMREL